LRNDLFRINKLQ